MGFLELYGLTVLVMWLMVTALWLLSVPLKDASIIDMLWGPLFVVTAWVLLYASAELHLKPYLVTLLVTLWGLRLAFHLVSRNIGRGEDRRYRRWRENGGPNWWLESYYRVYLVQAGIAVLVAAPIVAAFYRAEGFGLVALAGVLVWAVGFVFELVADVQLARFKAEPGNQARVMDEGLWGLSCHPNYFGDALQWWGVGILALTGDTWWALLGPAVMTAVFLRVSNDVLERDLGSRNPQYARYVESVSRFVPWRRR